MAAASCVKVDRGGGPQSGGALAKSVPLSRMPSPWGWRGHYHVHAGV